MTRRSTAAKIKDERRFRVRLSLTVPPMGFGQTLNELYAWLDQRVGRGNYAVHAHRDIGRNDELWAFINDADAAAELDRWMRGLVADRAIR